jgi:CBS domain-containing protein
VHHAAELVAMSGVSDLMVVDGEGRFVGVLSEGDILRAALPDIDDLVPQSRMKSSAVLISSF